MGIEHYVTSMTAIPSGNLVIMACRCGVIVMCPPYQADEQFFTHRHAAMRERGEQA